MPYSSPRNVGPEEDFADVAEASFAFLDRVTNSENVFWPIGNSDWYPHGERKSLYDQQPVEAVTMADAALAAFSLLRDEKYLSTFCRAHDWFHGRNSLKVRLVDSETGACFDGLQETGLNRNQGAESTLAHLWTEVHNVEMQLVVDETLHAAEGTERHRDQFGRPAAAWFGKRTALINIIIAKATVTQAIPERQR